MHLLHVHHYAGKPRAKFAVTQAATLFTDLSEVAVEPSNCRVALPYSELLSCQQLICTVWEE